MSLNQVVNQGVYTGVPVGNNGGLQLGNNQGPKAWAIETANTITLAGSFVGNTSGTTFNASASPTVQQMVNAVVGGLILSNNTTAPTVITIPSGFAQGLLTALGGAVSATVPSNRTIQLGMGISVQVCNSGAANGVSFASSDANTILYDANNQTLDHSSRDVIFQFSNLAIPQVTVY